MLPLFRQYNLIFKAILKQLVTSKQGGVSNFSTKKTVTTEDKGAAQLLNGSACPPLIGCCEPLWTYLIHIFLLFQS